MTKFHDDNSAKKSGLGKFLSGVSGVALLLGATYGTARGGTTIQGPNNFSVTNFGTTDFLIIDTGAIVFGNVTNSGTLGPSANPLVVRSGGIVTEGVVNTSLALITATATGIAFTGPLNDVNTGISNAGLINVAGTGSLNGIRITGSSVVTTISNAGTIKVSVASASTSTASGTATGIHISSAGSLSAAITNSGLIDVDALMRASGSSVTAYADAAGINQFASSAASAPSVALAVVNFATRIFGTGTGTGTTVTGSLDVFASAVATGSASATATAIGVHQTISGAPAGSTASTLFINQGIVEVGAVAFASGSWAVAEADARGVRQEISGSADSASATFTNETSASFDVFATAIAKGTSSSATWATASAAGVWQTVSGGLSAAAAINNNGTFNVAALATATGSVPFASAVVGTGFFQSAFGTGGAGSTATALITNAGDINVLALAVAVGTNGTSGLGLSADASARVADFISQTARNAETLSVTFNNDGSIDVGAIAIASNAVGASASASIGTGIQLGARPLFSFFGPGPGSVATVTFSNSGSISLSALAAATGASQADARVRFNGSVVGLFARDETASASFVNSGTISAVINAQALAANGSASADVNMSSYSMFALNAGAGFFGRLGSVATVSFSNSGSISFSALAAATGTSQANARVRFSSGAGVVGMHARAATASASFVNSGTLSVVMNAQALATSGSASAGVFMSSMFDLDARAGSFGNLSNVATVSFANSGTISLSGLAAATGASQANARVAFSSGGGCRPACCCRNRLGQLCQLRDFIGRDERAGFCHQRLGLGQSLYVFLDV